MRYLDSFGSVQDLITLRGDFPCPTGELTREGNTFRFLCDTLEVVTCFTEHASGVTRRQDQIRNLSDRPITIQTAFSKFVFHGGEYEVYTQYSEHCSEAHGQWQPLVTEIAACSEELRCSAVNAPFLALRSLQSGRGMAFHIADGCQWRYRARRCFLQHGRKRTVCLELGVDNTNLRYTLAPGETFALPQILFYSFRNAADMDAYKLHRYCCSELLRKPLPVIYNSWMSRFDDISYELLSQQLELAAQMGMEYFVIDAGWFGQPFKWATSVGDWEECQTSGMAGRMLEFAQLVRSRGLKFGLWFEIERASLSSRIFAEHPEYFLVGDKRAFLNFAKPEAVEHAYHTISEHIRHYGIDFIKFDFNGVFTTDDSGQAFLPYFRGYSELLRRLREAFPHIYMEGCASGGMRIGLSTLRYFDSYWLTDNQNLHAQMDIFTHTLLRMPARSLETWITIQTLPEFSPRTTGGTREALLTGDGDWRYLESVREEYVLAAMLGGPIGISCDLTRIAPALRDKLTEVICQFKQERDFWNRSECRILTDTPSLIVLQYSTPEADMLKLFAYTRYAAQNEVTVYPVCPQNTCYCLPDGTAVTAQSLDEDGIVLPLLNEKYTTAQLTLTRLT